MTVTTFKRARSEEQRTERRRLILATAEAMLTEMPAAQVTLNELSRRVGLAKSNVLRYFESREAVLLELLDIASVEWLGRLGDAFTAAVDPSAPPTVRGDQIAAALVTALTERPLLCDLVSTQAAVLEHNVSAQIAAQVHTSLRAQSCAAISSSAGPGSDTQRCRPNGSGEHSMSRPSRPCPRLQWNLRSPSMSTGRS